MKEVRDSKNRLSRWFGDRNFYRMTLMVAMPMVLQNLVSTFVNLLDNIMVGRVGTLQMSGVSIVNQLMFVFNLCIFGAVSGAGIFTAQFAGKGDDEGIRYTMRYKFCIVLILAAGAIALLMNKGTALASLYLTGDGSAEDISETLRYAQEYLNVMLYGLVPFALSSIYSDTMRETGQTVVPMVNGIISVITNLILNYILIFGNFGAPVLGVAGAAWATVASRFAELFLNAGWLHSHGTAHPYVKGIYSSLFIPGRLLKQIILKGLPLMFNEVMWSVGVVTLAQFYSTRGLEVVAAYNISSTLGNLASVSYVNMGSAVGIILGRMLGSGVPAEEIRDSRRKLSVFSILVSSVFAIVMAAVSGLFPLFYNTTDSIRSMAASLICLQALFMPFHAYVNAAYYTLRAGGKTLVTVLFDSGFMWAVSLPFALAVTKLTSLTILPLYLVCSSADILKCVMGAVWIRTDTWIHNLTE